MRRLLSQVSFIGYYDPGFQEIFPHKLMKKRLEDFQIDRAGVLHQITDIYNFEILHLPFPMVFVPIV